MASESEGVLLWSLPCDLYFEFVMTSLVSYPCLWPPKSGRYQKYKFVQRRFASSIIFVKYAQYIEGKIQSTEKAKEINCVARGNVKAYPSNGTMEVSAQRQYPPAIKGGSQSRIWLLSPSPSNYERVLASPKIVWSLRPSKIKSIDPGI